MNNHLLLILIAPFTTFILIALLRPFAKSIGLTDKPNDRKRHEGSVPLIGGIAMYFGIVVSLLLTNDLNQFNVFILASLIVVIIGILDDHKDISVSLRLFFQALTSIIIVSVAGINIESLGNLLGNGDIIINNWSYFISMIAIIASMNAVNMTDGIHGHAGGSSLITFLAILFLSIGKISNDNLLIIQIFCLVLPIFLIYNLCIGMPNSRRIFMGDAGSMLIGLGISWTLIDLSQGENQVFSPVTALWLFGMPIIEICTTVLRRLASSKSLFKPDLLHFHHLLLSLGFSNRAVLISTLSISFIMASIGILGELFRVAEWVMLSGFLLTFLIYIITASKRITNKKNSY